VAREERDPTSAVLTSLEPGQRIPFGGDRVAVVPDELARDFRAGDRLIVVQSTGDLLRVPAEVSVRVGRVVDEAAGAFSALSELDDEAISAFYEEFARRLEDDRVFGPISEANRSDVDDARRRGRSTTRLELSEKMRLDMVSSLRMWRDVDIGRDRPVDEVRHETWRVEERRSPLGVVGFVFEGRPNVFADATGVLRTGNTVVFRIGSDALGTARAIMEHAVRPSLAASGLPTGSVGFIDEADRAAGYSLFSDVRLGLAVARGSGAAVELLGAVARQSGVPASLHGTGGAWIMVRDSVSSERLRSQIEASLDRKVCNTANVVVCIPGSSVRDVVAAADAAARRRGHESAIVHVRAGDRPTNDLVDGDSRWVTHDDEDFLAVEWEWDDRPELSVISVVDLDEAIELFDRWSPRFVVAILSDEEADLEHVYRSTEAPFVGDGFTRWVDGQYALGRPELGLSNWQNGRLFGRGGILSGDGVFAVRHVARHSDPSQRR